MEAGGDLGGMPVTIGRLRARTDLGDIRHVKLEARRGARSRGTGRVEQARVIREGGDHDRAASSSCTYFATHNLDEKPWDAEVDPDLGWFLLPTLFPS